LNHQGFEAEQLAATFLQQQGLKLLESNYRCRFGEIDLIMQDGKEVVFVEVRLRSNGAFGGAGSSITPAKQHKLALTAQDYLMRHGTSACRFDAVLLTSLDTRQLEWIRNAFETT
jgi:putative endonuclease